MQATNYFRQLTKETERNLEIVERLDSKNLVDSAIEVYLKALNLNKVLITGYKDAEKFILPEFGLIMNDSLKGLENFEAELRLPYEKLVIEFSDPTAKTILFCQEIRKGGQDNSIAIISLVKGKHDTGFCLSRAACFLDTTVYEYESSNESSGPKVRIKPFDPIDMTLLTKESKLVESEVDYSDMLLDIKQFLVLPVLELIEALSCKNVTSEYLPHKHSAAKHAALGFDEYRVLTITVAGCRSIGNAKHTGGHASPREHLRRGHIRRHPTAGNIWINSMVVNAGVGGVIRKTYKMEPA